MKCITMLKKQIAKDELYQYLKKLELCAQMRLMSRKHKNFTYFYTILNEF